MKITSRLNQLPPPEQSVSARMAETKAKAEFKKLIQELKKLEPVISNGEKAREQAVAAIEKYLKGKPRGDRDKTLQLIAGALGKGVRTLYRWIQEENDPEAAAERQAADREAKAESVKVEPLQAFVEAVGIYLRATNDDADGILQVIRDKVPTEKICAALKGLCRE